MGLSIFAGLLALPGLVVLAAFREWAACFLLIMQSRPLPFQVLLQKKARS